MRRKLRNGALIAALAAIGLVAHTTQDLIAQTSLWRHWTCALGVSNSSSNEPTNIQWVGNALFATGSTTNPVAMVVNLVDPCEQGDTVWITGQYGNGADVINTITDDAGGTLANGAWVKDKTQPNATDNQSAVILRRSNCPAGLFKITVGFSSATGFCMFSALKSNCIAPFSPVVTSTAANPAATTALAAGSMTTTVDDCFWIYVAANTSPGNPTKYFRATAPADTNDFTARLWANASPDGFVCMYGMKRSQGAFNPTLTAGAAWTRSAVAAVCYKTAPGVGSKPLVSYGGRIKFVQVINNGTTNGGNFTSPLTTDIDVDPEVNGLAITYDDPHTIFSGTTPNWAAANMSDSKSNTWSATVPQLCGTGGGGPTTGWTYTTNGTYGKGYNLTQAFSGSPNKTTNSMLTMIFGMVGVGAFDTVQGFGANPNVAVPTTRTNVLPTPIQPSQSRAIILMSIQEDQQSVGSISATNGGVVRVHMDDPGVYETDEGLHDGGLGHQYHDAAVGTSYNYNVGYVNYESGLNLTNYGGQWIAFTCLGPLLATDYSRFPERSLRR